MNFKQNYLLSTNGILCSEKDTKYIVNIMKEKYCENQN